MPVSATLSDPRFAVVEHYDSHDFSTVDIAEALLDGALPTGSYLTMHLKCAQHEQAAEEIAAVINKWCNPDSLAGTCEKLLAEEEERRKAAPVAIDERFMERVE